MVEIYKHAYEDEERYIVVLTDDLCIYFGKGYGDNKMSPYENASRTGRKRAMQGDAEALHKGVWGEPIYRSEGAL